MNNSYLEQYLRAVVTGISVDAGNDTVLVQASVNLVSLFPSAVPARTISETGLVKIRASAR
jgi:hypothetical protein